LIQKLGDVSEQDLAKTFNLGIGMVAIIDPAAESETLAFLSQQGLNPRVIGSVRPRLSGENGDSPAKGGKGGAVFVR
jgi:phosphoribosylformylglycinamidine cyclo-ligase